MKALCSFLLIFLATYGSIAQKIGHVSVGVSANAYRGDLSTSLDKWTSVYHIGYKFNASKKLNGNVNLAFGLINGENFNYSFGADQIPQPNPNRFFRTPLFILNYDLHYNVLNWKNFVLYISQGFGIIRFNPQDDFSEDLQNQPSTRALGETFSNIALILPTQIGISYTLPNDFGFSFQFGLMNTFTDYLDNISDWGVKNGDDNIYASRFSFFIPVTKNINSQ